MACSAFGLGAWSSLMRHRVAAVLAALTGLVVATVLCGLERDRQPGYCGKPLNAWLADLDLGPAEPSAKAAEAARAIRTIGTNSFPWLLKMLRADEPLWKRAAIVLNSSQSLVRMPVTPANLIRARAIEGYSVLEGSAADAVPELIRLLDSTDSPQVRASAATALGRIGRGARSAIPALRKAAGDENAEVRKSALVALANIQMWMNDPVSRGF